MKPIFAMFIIIVLAACSSDPICQSGPLYCYRTLAAADCFSTPQNGQERRLINFDMNAYYSIPQTCPAKQ